MQPSMHPTCLFVFFQPSHDAMVTRNRVACPITPCALAAVKTKWRISGELVNKYFQLCVLLMLHTNYIYFWKLSKHERLQCTILWRSELFRCRLKDLHIVSTNFELWVTSKYHALLTVVEKAFKWVTFVFLLEYISKEPQDIPMDWHSATERNAQSLFITELLRGKQIELFSELDSAQKTICFSGTFRGGA